MLKEWNVTPSVANTASDLIPAADITSGNAAMLFVVKITAVTAATAKLIYYSGTAIVHTIPLVLNAGDTAVLDGKDVLPSGMKLQVQSTATDTTFIACGSVDANN